MENHYLYKYRPLFRYNSNNKVELNEFTKLLLTKGELYFSNPDEYNDPFDSKFYFMKSYKKIDAIRYFESRPLLERQGANEVINNSFNYDKFVELISSVSSDFRIFCLSADPLNILMWSHYASNHSGICIGLKADNHTIKVKTDSFNNTRNIPSLDEGRLIAKPIYYPEGNSVPHIINPFKYDIKDIEDILYTKSSLWSYEREYRFLLPSEVIPSNKAYLTKNSIGRVIFGLKVPQDLKITIIKTIKNNNKDVTFYETRKVHGKYELELVEINSALKY